MESLSSFCELLSHSLPSAISEKVAHHPSLSSSRLLLPSDPSRTLNAIEQHHYHQKVIIDELVLKIKRQATGGLPSSSSSRPRPPPSRPSFSNNNDGDGASPGGEDRRDFKPSSSTHRSENSQAYLVPCPSGLPCFNCKALVASYWHRLKEIETGEQKFCAGCRGVCESFLHLSSLLVAGNASAETDLRCLN